MQVLAINYMKADINGLVLVLRLKQNESCQQLYISGCMNFGRHWPYESTGKSRIKLDIYRQMVSGRLRREHSTVDKRGG